MWVEEASTVDISHIERFFTNQQYDKESGLYYYNSRYYDPHLGSFISPDPGMSGLNHYAYANSNPIRYTDPTGFVTENEAQEQYETEYGDEASSGVSFDDWCGPISEVSISEECAGIDGNDESNNEDDRTPIEKFNDWVHSLPNKQEEYWEDAQRHANDIKRFGHLPPGDWIHPMETGYLAKALGLNISFSLTSRLSQALIGNMNNPRGVSGTGNLTGGSPASPVGTPGRKKSSEFVKGMGIAYVETLLTIFSLGLSLPFHGNFAIYASKDDARQRGYDNYKEIENKAVQLTLLAYMLGSALQSGIQITDSLDLAKSTINQGRMSFYAGVLKGGNDGFVPHPGYTPPSDPAGCIGYFIGWIGGFLGSKAFLK